MVFSEYTETNATSLVLLDIILPEKCAIIIGFSCTIVDYNEVLADTLTNGVLADAILIPPHSPT